MEVKISRDSLPLQADPSLLHLNDPGCGVHHVDERNVIMKTPLEGCGTVKSANGEQVSFHNKVVIPSGFGNKRSMMEFPFRCAYRKIGLP